MGWWRDRAARKRIMLSVCSDEFSWVVGGRKGVYGREGMEGFGCC